MISARAPLALGRLQFGKHEIHHTHDIHCYRGLAWCASCGMYATAAPRKLRLPCAPRTRAGLDYLRRLAQGLPPKVSVSWPEPELQPDLPVVDGPEQREPF